jgi:hypothetical protein
LALGSHVTEPPTAALLVRVSLWALVLALVFWRVRAPLLACVSPQEGAALVRSTSEPFD